MCPDETPDIDGQTRIIGIVGDPIAQVRSPQVFNAYFRQHAVNAAVMPMHVGRQDIGAVLEVTLHMRNLAGLIVTIPHKAVAHETARIVSPLADRCGAANALRPDVGLAFWHGDIFDGLGLVRAIANRNIPLRSRHALVIGAGGAGAAIAAALQMNGEPESISVFDTDRARSTALAERLGLRRAETADCSSCGVVVNATPVGMGQDESPLDTAQLAEGMLVCDAVMHPPDTRLLIDARARGCTVVRGEEMLRGQVELITEFLGLQPESTPQPSTKEREKHV